MNRVTLFYRGVVSLHSHAFHCIQGLEVVGPMFNSNIIQYTWLTKEAVQANIMSCQRLLAIDNKRVRTHPLRVEYLMGQKA